MIVSALQFGEVSTAPRRRGCPPSPPSLPPSLRAAPAAPRRAGASGPAAGGARKARARFGSGLFSPSGAGWLSGPASSAFLQPAAWTRVLCVCVCIYIHICVSVCLSVCTYVREQRRAPVAALSRCSELWTVAARSTPVCRVWGALGGAGPRPAAAVGAVSLPPRRAAAWQSPVAGPPSPRVSARAERPCSLLRAPGVTRAVSAPRGVVGWLLAVLTGPGRELRKICVIQELLFSALVQFSHLPGDLLELCLGFT